MIEQHRFGNVIAPITCHAWNKNRTQIALSPNNHEIHIYQRKAQEWTLVDVLNQHDMRVMGIDWAPNTNRLVTCAADRNAYVWTQDECQKWRPTLVLLRMNRAATCVKWSPLENKFAVGSGARLISICYFESENNWWVSKHIKKSIRSSITCLDWHPNNMLLVAGSTDFKVRIFSTCIKDIKDDEKVADVTPWGSKAQLGHLVSEFCNPPGGSGWVHSVSFSPCGNRICWVAHDSSINVVDVNRSNVPCKLRTDLLPFLCCVWINSNAVIAAGHCCIPVLYKINGTSGELEFVAKLDNSQRKEAAGLTAMRMFHSLDKQARIEATDTSLNSVHQNAINCICKYEANNNSVTKFSTSGSDGQLVIWDLNALDKSLQALKLS